MKVISSIGPVETKLRPRVESLDPVFVAESVREMYVDAAEAKLNRVNARCCPRRNTKAESAVKQRVVVLESIFDPASLGESFLITLNLHVSGDPVEGPLLETKWSLPDMIVGQFKQIDIHHRHQHH